MLNKVLSAFSKFQQLYLSIYGTTNNPTWKKSFLNVFVFWQSLLYTSTWISLAKWIICLIIIELKWSLREFGKDSETHGELLLALSDLFPGLQLQQRCITAVTNNTYNVSTVMTVWGPLHSLLLYLRRSFPLLETTFFIIIPQYRTSQSNVRKVIMTELLHK